MMMMSSSRVKRSVRLQVDELERWVDFAVDRLARWIGNWKRVVDEALELDDELECAQQLGRLRALRQRVKHMDQLASTQRPQSLGSRSREIATQTTDVLEPETNLPWIPPRTTVEYCVRSESSWNLTSQTNQIGPLNHVIEKNDIAQQPRHVSVITTRDTMMVVKSPFASPEVKQSTTTISPDMKHNESICSDTNNNDSKSTSVEMTFYDSEMKETDTKNETNNKSKADNDQANTNVCSITDEMNHKNPQDDDSNSNSKNSTESKEIKIKIENDDSMDCEEVESILTIVMPQGEELIEIDDNDSSDSNSIQSSSSPSNADDRTQKSQNSLVIELSDSALSSEPEPDSISDSIQFTSKIDLIPTSTVDSISNSNNINLIQHSKVDSISTPQGDLIQNENVHLTQNAKLDSNKNSNVHLTQTPKVDSNQTSIQDKSKESIKSSSQLYQCSKCEKGYPKLSELESHLKSHHGPKFHCGECERNFRTEARLERHIFRRHKKNSSHQCEHCNKSYPTQLSLDQHYCPRKPFRCEQCSARFVTNAERRAHRRETHHLQKYQCHLCSKSYRQASGLQYHLATHTGDRPYKCCLCPRGFVFANLLRIHLRRTHHANEDGTIIGQQST